MRGLAAALILVTACGETAPSAVTPVPPAPRVIPAGGPPSVPVLQARPGRLDSFGWLTDTLAYVVDGRRLHVWDPATGRVLFAGEVPALELGMEPVRRVGDRVVLPGAELVLERGEVVDAPGEVVSSDAEVYAIRAFHDDDVELTLHHRGTVAAATVVAPQTAGLSYSRDASTLMVCLEDGARFHDAATGAERASLSLEAVEECAWPEGEGPLVVIADRTLHLFDPRSFAPVGAPVPHVVHAHVSPDGSRLGMATVSSREGVTVRELASDRELLHVSCGAPSVVRVVGDLVAYDTEGYAAGSIRRISTDPAGDEVASGPSVSIEHVGPLGALVEDEGVLTVRTREGEVARLEHPAAATLLMFDGELDARVGETYHWLDASGSGRFGACPPESDENPMGLGLRLGPVGVRIGRRRYLASAGCLALDDGTTAPSAGWPYAESEDGRVSLWSDGGVLTIHEGEARRRLVLDEDEAQPCTGPRCMMPIALSHDGAWLAIARGPLLRVFDTSTGEARSRATVAGYTQTLAFLASGALVQEDAGEGALRIFAPPGRGPLRERRRVEVSSRSRDYARVPTVVHGDWVLHTGPAGLRVYDGAGRVLGTAPVSRRSSVLPSGAVVWVEEGDTAVARRLPSLDELARTEGRPRAVVGEDAFLCRGSASARVRFEEERLVEVPSSLGCTTSVVRFGAGWLAEDGTAAILLRSDGRALALSAVQYGDRIVLGGRDGDRVVGPMRWLLRSPGLTAEGMVPALPALPSIEAWLAEAP